MNQFLSVGVLHSLTEAYFPSDIKPENMAANLSELLAQLKGLRTFTTFRAREGFPGKNMWNALAMQSEHHVI